MRIDPSTATESGLIESVCDSLGFPPEHSKVLPVVFSHCASLGGLHTPVLQLLKIARVNSRSSILDLACGKGLIACAITQRFRAHVRGVDACGALLREARANARSARVSDRVTFRRADVLSMRPTRHHVAIMIGWLGAEHAPGVLRQHVIPGGSYIFDDATECRNPSRAREIVREIVAGFGDTLVASRTVRPAMIRAALERNLVAIESGLHDAVTIDPSCGVALQRWFKRFRRHSDLIAVKHVVGYRLCRRAS